MQKCFAVDFATYQDMDSLDNVTFHKMHANKNFYNMMDMAASNRQSMLSARVLTHVLINENFAIE